VTRLGLAGRDITSAQIGHPGESTYEFLTGRYGDRKGELLAAIDPERDNYVIIELFTNDLNQRYIETVKQNARELIAWLKSVGIKGIIWSQTAACKSPYAYAIDSSNNIIGGNDLTQRRAGFDQARLVMNNDFLPSLVNNGSLVGIGNLSIYPKIYPQAQASDPLYYLPAGVGPYGSGEPGNVHWTEYGEKYVSEAWAQACAPMLGIILNPPTITIPDAVAPITPGATPAVMRARDANVTISGADSNVVTGTSGIDQFLGFAVSTKKLAALGTLRFILGDTDAGTFVGIARVDTVDGTWQKEFDAEVYYDNRSTVNTYLGAALKVNHTGFTTIALETLDFIIYAHPSDSSKYLLDVAFTGKNGRTGDNLATGLEIPAGQYMLKTASSSNARSTAFYVQGALVAN
jgi:hypothetical protein